MSTNSNLIIDLHITTNVNGKIKQKNNIKSITLSERTKEENEHDGEEREKRKQNRKG